MAQTLTRRLLLACALLAVATGARAQSGTKPPAAGAAGPAANPAAAINRLLTQEGIAQALLQACDGQDAAGAAARAQRFAQWRRDGGLEALEPALIARLGTTALQAQRQAAIARTLPDAQGLVGRTPALCANFQAALAAPALALAEPVAAARTALAAGDAPAGTRFVSLAQLSARALPILNARPEGQPDDRHAREARERAAGQSLTELGNIAIRGHVERRGWVREWRGDEQSIMALRCRRYAERHGQQALEALEGQEVVLSGGVAEVSGRVITMGDCRLLPATTALAPPTALPEAGGLEPRPLTAAEANAGPGRGIAPADIAQVIHTSRFDQRMDGMFNLYMDREEHVFVLLRDGSAYRHDWAFPFTDLNLPLSHRREPGRWLRWRQDGEAVALQDAGGRDIRLSQPRPLLPVAAGTRFDHHYYFLNVGLGGFRRDRSYSFRADGTVTLSASNLVAANLGPNGFIAATRPGSRNEARYAFDGYVLSLTDADGHTERRLVGQFAPARGGAAPDSLILGGQIYWTRDADQGGDRRGTKR